MPFVKMMPYGHKPTVLWLWSILLWYLECPDMNALTHWQQCTINGRSIQIFVIQPRYFTHLAVRCCQDQQFYHSWKNSFVKWLTRNDQCSEILVTYCVIYTLWVQFTHFGYSEDWPVLVVYVYFTSVNRRVLTNCWCFSAAVDYVNKFYGAWLSSSVT